MRKKDKKDNALIKKTNLAEKLKKAGIKRINGLSLDEIEKFLNWEIEQLAALFKERLIIKGKKTLSAEDVKESVKKIRENRQEDYED